MFHYIYVTPLLTMTLFLKRYLFDFSLRMEYGMCVSSVCLIFIFTLLIFQLDNLLYLLIETLELSKWLIMCLSFFFSSKYKSCKFWKTYYFTYIWSILYSLLLNVFSFGSTRYKCISWHVGVLVNSFTFQFDAKVKCR